MRSEQILLPNQSVAENFIEDRPQMSRGSEQENADAPADSSADFSRL
jgi:hypothetical protein